MRVFLLYARVVVDMKAISGMVYVTLCMSVFAKMEENKVIMTTEGTRFS